MNHALVGTARCDVPARAIAGGTVAPLNAARTARRAVPTWFMVPMRVQNWKSRLSMNRVAQPCRQRVWFDFIEAAVAESDAPKNLRSNVEIADVQGVVLDELLARLDFLAHELGEHLFGFDGVGKLDAKQLSLGRLHGRLEEF